MSFDNEIHSQGYKWWQWVLGFFFLPVLILMIIGVSNQRLRPKLSYGLIWTYCAVPIFLIGVCSVFVGNFAEESEVSNTSSVQTTPESTTASPWKPPPTRTPAEVQAEIDKQRQRAERHPTASATVSRPSLQLDPDLRCLRDAECIADRSDWMLDAEFACKWAVERLARYDMRWTDGFLEDKFRSVIARPPEYKTFLLIGDKAQFQNGFGAWQNVTYTCIYDPLNEVPKDASVVPK